MNRIPTGCASWSLRWSCLRPSSSPLSKGKAPVSSIAWCVEGEARFRELAQRIACHWRDHAPCRLLVGLEGPLGAGKTTWVRGMLEGLGHRGRVPSPTYTLLEHYELGEITLVHVDLYRLSSDHSAGRQAMELEAIGINDWRARPDAWLMVEWPDRSPRLLTRCDIRVTFGITSATERRITLDAYSPIGCGLLGKTSRKSFREFGSASD